MQVPLPYKYIIVNAVNFKYKESKLPLPVYINVDSIFFIESYTGEKKSHACEITGETRSIYIVDGTTIISNAGIHFLTTDSVTEVLEKINKSQIYISPSTESTGKKEAAVDEIQEIHEHFHH
jgi:hypothetical protein